MTLLGYFGRPHFGAVKGITMSLVIAASALGPLPLALSKDLLGHYKPALMGLLVLPVLSDLAIWTARPPVQPREAGGITSS